LTRTYAITTSKGETLFWKADGALIGDFRLADKAERLLTRFKYRIFCMDELRSFEIVGRCMAMREI
jgi:hypothetical protein